MDTKTIDEKVNPTTVETKGATPNETVNAPKEFGKSYAEITKELEKEPFARVVTGKIVAIVNQLATAESGREYNKLLVTFAEPFIVPLCTVAGKWKLGASITINWYSLSQVLRRNEKTAVIFPTLDELSKIVKTDESGTPTFAPIGTALYGCRIKLVGQFVAAGESAENPYNNEPYEVKNEDRFIYHVVGLESVGEAVQAIVTETSKSRVASLFAEIESAKEKAKAIDNLPPVTAPF